MAKSLATPPSLHVKPATTILSRYLPFHPPFPLQTLEILLQQANKTFRALGSQIPSNVPSSTNSDIQGPRGRGPNIDRFHALTGIKFTSLPRVCRACTARGGRGRCPRPRPFFRSRGGALGRGFYTGGISSEFAPRSAVYENREGEEGGRESRKVAVISQNRQWQWERPEIERINSRHAGYAALSLSRIIGYFVPATPYGICYGKDLRILFRLLRLPFPSRGSPCGFPPPPAPGSRRR